MQPHGISSRGPDLGAEIRGGGEGEGRNVQGTQCEDAAHRDFGPFIQIGSFDEGGGEQGEHEVRDDADEDGKVRRDGGQRLAVAFARNGRVGFVAVPVELDGLALEDGDEDVEGVEDADDDQQDDDGEALPVVVDAQAEEEDADDKLDEGRDDNVGDLACPLEYESLGAVHLGDMLDVRPKAVGDTGDHDGAEGAL